VGTAPSFAALLDVVVEFRYDIRLCQFAPDQLSFAFCRAAADRTAFVLCLTAASPFSKRARV
jgi:hypothetical protein